VRSRLYDPAFPLGAIVSGVLSLVAIVGAAVVSVSTRSGLSLGLVGQSLAGGVALGLLWGGATGAFDRPLGRYKDVSVLAINNLPVLLAMAIVWALFASVEAELRSLALFGAAAAGLSNAAALFAWRAHYRRLKIGW